MTPISIGGEKQASISGGNHLPADIASGRIAEVRSKNAKAFLNKWGSQSTIWYSLWQDHRDAQKNAEEFLKCKEIVVL